MTNKHARVHTPGSCCNELRSCEAAPKADVYMGLGSNLGNREENLHRAVCEIEKQIGDVVALSAFYVTAPWGFASENHFLNAALHVRTSLPPATLLHTTQAIERLLGRMHKSSGGTYRDRLIDIDLLLYDDLVLSQTDDLLLPHPLMTERDFVMRPLAEIAPRLVHPVLHRTMKEILLELESRL